MTKEELYQKWVIQEYDTKGIDREAFFKDVDTYFSAEVTRIAADTLGGLND